MTTRNIALLRAVRDHIKWHPEAHEQSWWAVLSGLPERVAQDRAGDQYAVSACATTACAAGWTCLLAGDLLVSRWYETDRAREVLTIDGDVVHVPWRAQQLLGLSDREAQALFWNTESHEVTLDLLDKLIKDDPDDGAASN